MISLKATGVESDSYSCDRGSWNMKPKRALSGSSIYPKQDKIRSPARCENFSRIRARPSARRAVAKAMHPLQ